MYLLQGADGLLFSLSSLVFFGSSSARQSGAFTDGVLGLGYGKSSIITQLKNLGMIRSVVGHYLSGQGGGFLIRD